MANAPLRRKRCPACGEFANKWHTCKPKKAATPPIRAPRRAPTVEQAPVGFASAGTPAPPPRLPSASWSSSILTADTTAAAPARLAAVPDPATIRPEQISAAARSNTVPGAGWTAHDRIDDHLTAWDACWNTSSGHIDPQRAAHELRATATTVLAAQKSRSLERVKGVFPDEVCRAAARIGRITGASVPENPRRPGHPAPAASAFVHAVRDSMAKSADLETFRTQRAGLIRQHLTAHPQLLTRVA